MNVTLPQFYIDLLEVWADTREFQIKYEPYKWNEVRFNNKFIRVNGKCIFYENLFEKNIYKSKHIMDHNGNLKSITFFQRLGLKENDFEMIQTIYETIPVNWKRNMKRNENDTRVFEEITFVLGERIVTRNYIVSKKIYAALLKKKTLCNT